MNILLMKIILLIKVIPATSNSSSSSSSNYIAGGGPSGSWINSTSRSIKETTDRVSLCNNNNLSDPETDPVLMK